MAPPIRQANVPPMADCVDAIQRAVIIKLNTAPSYKLTAEKALEMVGFEPSVSSNPSMLARFWRLYNPKLKELQQGVEPSSLQFPSTSLVVAFTKKKPGPKTAAAVVVGAAAASAGAPPPPPPPAAAAATAVAAPTATATAAAPPRLVPLVVMPRPATYSRPPPPKKTASKRPTKRPAPLFSKTFNPKTPKQLEAAFKRQQKQRQKESDAMSVATQRYAEEKKKPKDDRMSAQKIVDQVNAEFGTNISYRTLIRYVQSGFVGQGLKKGGRPPYKHKNGAASSQDGDDGTTQPSGNAANRQEGNHVPHPPPQQPAAGGA